MKDISYGGTHMSWETLEDNTNSSKLTAMRRIIITHARSSLFLAKCSDALIKVGNTNHDAIDIELKMIACTADMKNLSKSCLTKLFLAQ